MASEPSASASSLRRPNVERNRAMKSNITRVRTGCFTCRRRRKKCDETKPICANCQRTNLVCEGFPVQTHFQSRTGAKRTAGNEVSTSDLVSISNSSSAGQATATFDLDRSDDQSQAAMPEITSVFHNQDLDHEFDFIFGDFGQPSGALTARISGNHLAYQPEDSYLLTVQSGRELELVPQETFTNFFPAELPFLIPGATYPKLFLSTEATFLNWSLTKGLTVETKIHRRLFCHFTDVMSHLLTTFSGDSNPFNAVVIPMAMGDKTVMNTILCLAGSHLGKLQPMAIDAELDAERRRLHADVLKSQSYRIRTLKESKARLESLYSARDQEVMFATSLGLCIYEVCEGTGDDAWKTHLDTARQIVSLASSAQESPDTLTSEISPFLLEFFVYHESLATVTAPSFPTIKPKLHGLTYVSDQNPCVIGVQDGLIDFVTRISTLRCQAELSPLKPDGNIICKAVSIWQDLDNWKPLANLSKERKLIGEFYRWALFIWLFSIVHPDSKADSKVQNAVSNIAAGMYEIKFGDGVMACLLFPLFVIGSAAIKVEDRETISAHFRRLRAWSSLGNIDLAYRVVLKMWEDHDHDSGDHDSGDHDSGASWDWVKQLEAHGISVLVT